MIFSCRFYGCRPIDKDEISSQVYVCKPIDKDEISGRVYDCKPFNKDKISRRIAGFMVASQSTRTRLRTVPVTSSNHVTEMSG